MGHFLIKVDHACHCEQVLCGYFTWSASTSGVEQLFSKIKRSPVELASASVDTDRRLAIVMGDDAQGMKSDEDTLITEAQKLYVGLLRSGKARASAKTRRLNAGSKRKLRPLPGKKKTEAQWHRRRRAAVARATRDDAELVTPPRRAPVELPQSLQKETDRQRTQAGKRKAEAFLDGYLLDEEITDSVRQVARDQLRGNNASDAKRRKAWTTYEETRIMANEMQTRQWALRDLPTNVWLDKTEPGLHPAWQAMLRQECRASVSFCTVAQLQK